MIGVYQIRNIVNSKLYIGSAISIKKRWQEHVRALNKGQHYNKKLQRAWNKYGANLFKFEIIEYTSQALLLSREQYYLDTLLYASCDNSKFDKLSYNICRVAGNMLGHKHSVKTRKKISEANKGKKYSIETRKKMSEIQRGKKHSIETRQKISRIHKGKNHYFYGKKHSIESKNKIRVKIAKLTEGHVFKIKELLKECLLTQHEMAYLFNISRRAISDIKTGKTWSYLDV
mgnify:CR=1 FL=1